MIGIHHYNSNSHELQTCKQILINPADGRRYSSTAHEVANAKTPGKQKSAEKNVIIHLHITQVI